MDEADQKNSESLEKKLEQAEKEKNEYLLGWQRAKADFINYKKEELKRLEEIAKYGLEDLVGELVTVMDNFDLGLAALEKSGPVEKGIYMIRSQIADILKKRGLEKIEVAAGDPFNPGTAEAITEIESDRPPGSIVEIIEPGYRLNGKMLRAARVKISKKQVKQVES
ncbi:MAG: molecular chaperone GrpE [Parcubacteria group bacterium Gr01-1014_20]|nr:MAG: molecular chaperone GrpE [Parcubacteria group bacterium Gr01-1014_20]